MRRTRIKIDGVRRAEDAAAAARAGADAVGIVFHRGARRHVGIPKAREIIAALPALVVSLGVFVNDDLSFIREVISATGIDIVQLHGNESPEMAAMLAPKRVLKAMPAEEALLAEWREAAPGNLAGIILDSRAAHGAAAAGAGVENDWDAVDVLLRNGRLEFCPWIAAGGLNPQNAGEVVRRLRPAAVDVSSGVEEKFGEKSLELMEAFVRAVREADAETEQ